MRSRAFSLTMANTVYKCMHVGNVNAISIVVVGGGIYVCGIYLRTGDVTSSPARSPQHHKVAACASTWEVRSPRGHLYKASRRLDPR
jgi:hypothetical protein